jgi:pimeloyl-ACP methyl ester carboxylesterase
MSTPQGGPHRARTRSAPIFFRWPGADGVEIFYKDWGKGQPIVFSHGWPLSADDWDTQMLFFLNHTMPMIWRRWRRIST